MQRITVLSVVLLSLSLSGCDTNESCEPLAKHITAINVKEAKEKPSDEMIAKSEKELADACNKEPPKKELIDCAMAAESSEALVACDPKKGEKK
jgi:hypothetical protein